MNNLINDRLVPFYIDCTRQHNICMTWICISNVGSSLGLELGIQKSIETDANAFAIIEENCILTQVMDNSSLDPSLRWSLNRLLPFLLLLYKRKWNVKRFIAFTFPHWIYSNSNLSKFRMNDRITHVTLPVNSPTKYNCQCSNNCW